MAFLEPKPPLPDPWPFDQRPRWAVVTTSHIMRNAEPIVYVFHDEDDHGWQFHWAGERDISDAMLVAFEEVYFKDPTIMEVADLPPGWKASRDGIGSPWVRKENTRAEE